MVEEMEINYLFMISVVHMLKQFHKTVSTTPNSLKKKYNFRSLYRQHVLAHLDVDVCTSHEGSLCFGSFFHLGNFELWKETFYV